MKSIIVSVLLTLLSINNINANPIERSVATEFIILHNNDIHGRFEETSALSGKCSPEDAIENKCYGGFARTAHLVRKYRREADLGGPTALLFNAGDTYTGTPWFAVFKHEIASTFMNKLEPEVASLGNHEFDENIDGLIPFLNEVQFPVLACNLDLSKVPELAQTKNLANSTVLDVKGVKVGVIGYITPETKTLVMPNDVEFLPEIPSINAEAQKLKANGINIIIALGHSGYQMDQKIAAECPEVDIVVGGHTNTFLYNGPQPDTERIDGPYPTVVKQSSGKNVPVVQAYAYTKYLGKLHVQFDEAGNLIEFEGNAILLDSSVPKEDDVEQLLEIYRPNITELEQSVVGHTKVHLEGNAEVCRTEECNLGNLIADSMVFSRVLEDQGGYYWTDAAIAFIGGGGVRNSIEKNLNGDITEQDIITVLPFNNDLFVTEITGQTILNALEHSAFLRDQDSNGGFLQMSGVRVRYDYHNVKESNVSSVEVRCSQCDVPLYEPLNLAKTYKVILNDFFLNNGDGHKFQEMNRTAPIRLKNNDRQAFIQYLKNRDYVYPELEGRIQFISPSSDASALTSSLFMILASFLVKKFLL